eukprot:7778512-Pyramimonas_sp.AAC.1
MYTPGSRINQDPFSSADSNAGLEQASVYRVRCPISQSDDSCPGLHRRAVQNACCQHGPLVGPSEADGFA